MTARTAALLLIALGTSALARQQPPTSLTVKGDIPAPVTFSTADLDKLPQESATTHDEDGTDITYSGVLLRTVIEKAGGPAGKNLRGKGLASYILAVARDGYQVIFTPAEMDPAFANEKILLVYKRNGKPLFGYEGPFRIYCPNDKAGARSLRMLSSIEIVKLRK